MEALDTKVRSPKAGSVFYTNGKAEVAKSLSDAAIKSSRRKLPKDPGKDKQDPKGSFLVKESKNSRKDSKRGRKDTAKMEKSTPKSRNNSSSTESDTSSLRKDSLNVRTESTGAQPLVMHVDSSPLTDHVKHEGNRLPGSPWAQDGHSTPVNVSYNGHISPPGPGHPDYEVRYLGGYRPEFGSPRDPSTVHDHVTEERRYSEPYLASITMREMPRPLTPEPLYVDDTNAIILTYPKSREEGAGGPAHITNSVSPGAPIRRRTSEPPNKPLYYSQSPPGSGHVVGGKLKKMAVVSPLTGGSGTKPHSYSPGLLVFDPTDPESERLEQVCGFI